MHAAVTTPTPGLTRSAASFAPWQRGLLSLLWLLSLAVTSHAAALAPDRALSAELAEAVATAKLGDGVGIAIVDLESGRTVYSQHPQEPRNPASNMKVLTAAVALLQLGADHRFRTGLYGRQNGEEITGGLYLRGMGDPTLDTADLLALAGQLAMRGIRQVDRLIVDGSYFDDAYLPPAFEQQPRESAAFRAAVAALSVNRSAFSFRVTPGAGEGALGQVYLDAPAYFDLDNQVKTTPRGRLNVIAIQEDGDERMVLHLRGAIPKGISGVSYRRRVASPLHYAGHVMVGALSQVGIEVAEPLQVGKTASGTSLLAQHISRPLSQVLHELGKYSDNFVAEMLLKTLGAEEVAIPGTSADGVQVIFDQLQALGVDTRGMALVNGSGLFDGNRITPQQVSQVLLALAQRNDCFPEFLSQLAVAGKDGTLTGRLADLPADTVVRAKTGTLADVIGLSGYVMPHVGRGGFAFSFLANGIRGRQGEARALSDRLVSILARRLSQSAR